MAPVTKQNSKPVFKTSSPYADATWPQIPHSDQDIILELLCNLLQPIGDHRRIHSPPSKGKKRKRSTCRDAATNATSRPSSPSISKHLLIGLNSVTRHLEARAAATAPPTAPISEKLESAHDNSAAKPLSFVVLTHPKPSLSPAHAHLPTLVHLASKSSPSSSSSSTRLVPLSTSSDVRLATALHIPRVGALAVFEDAPGAKALEEGEWKDLRFRDGKEEEGAG
ncbi:RNase P and RNase MRP subunit [Coniothyrium glycines]